MTSLTPQFLFFSETLLFISVFSMYLAKKNVSVVFLYTVQSLIITTALFYSAFQEMSFLLMAVALLTLGVKATIAPYFLLKLIKKNRLHFSASTYLNIPMTLIVLALITAFSYSHFFQPLTVLSPNNENSLLLAVATILIAIFLIVNRKGVLSQMVGVLSLENAIVSFAFIAGLETTVGPQIGILFDIFVWVIIATIFASMIYRHFGSFDVSAMKQLKEE